MVHSLAANASFKIGQGYYVNSSLLTAKLHESTNGKVKAFPNSPGLQLNYGITKEDIAPSVDLAVLGHFQNELENREFRKKFQAQTEILF